MLEISLPEKTENEIINIITKTKGVMGFHKLKTRKMFNLISIEVHVKVDKELDVEDSHQYATRIEDALRVAFGTQMQLVFI